MQLRDVAAALRKQDDVNGVLAALRLVDGLVEAAPDELGQYAGVLLDAPCTTSSGVQAVA